MRSGIRSACLTETQGEQDEVLHEHSYKPSDRRGGVLDCIRRRTESAAKYTVNSNTAADYRTRAAGAECEVLEHSGRHPAAEPAGDDAVRARRHERDGSLYDAFGCGQRKQACRWRCKHSGHRRNDRAVNNDGAAQRASRCNPGRTRRCATAATDDIADGADASRIVRRLAVIVDRWRRAGPYSAAVHAGHWAGGADVATGCANFAGHSRHDGTWDVDSSGDPESIARWIAEGKKSGHSSIVIAEAMMPLPW
jgi:hypothetical protein